MKPFFTCVIPSLNQGEFLGQALRSVLEQRSDDVEVIVVDGGSTDGSVEIISRYSGRLGGERFGEGSQVLTCESAQEPEAGEVLKCESAQVGDAEETTANHANDFRTLELQKFRTCFLWCSEPDRGQSHALNKGFARARGRYLFWLNADDLLLPGALDRVRARVKAESPGKGGEERGPGPVRWLAGNQIYIDRVGRVLRCARGNHWHDFLYRNAPVHVYGPSSFFTKELLDQVGGVDESLRYCMDWDLWLKFKNAGARFSRIDDYCWALRQHAGSKTQGGERDKEHLHWREIHDMCRRNGLHVTGSGVWLQRAWRLLSGCYVASVWDTVVRRARRQSLAPSEAAAARE